MKDPLFEQYYNCYFVENKMEDIKEFRGETRWLSNFGSGKANYDGVWYPTSEHAYQAAKTLNEDDRVEILLVDTPAKARRLGSRVTLRPGWDDMRVQVMREILKSKYEANPDLREKLLATGDAQLVEGNYWGDTFWGQVDGQGANWLGVLLMEIRDSLRGGGRRVY